MARATLRDVARAAGVSRTTASNVVMNTGRVSDQTRARVRQAMADLGYVYNQAAGSLRRRSSRSVGVVVTNIHRPNFGELLIGIESTLTEAGYIALVVSSMDRIDRQQRAIATLREHDVAGLAMIPATGSGVELLDALDDWAVPMIFVARYLRGQQRPYVGPDDVRGGYLSMRHLLDHGCRRVAYLGSYPEVTSRIDRMAGARKAIEESGAEVEFFDWPCEPDGDGGLQAGRELVAAGDLPDGVLCHGDTVAMGFERALYDAGRIDDVRVIGYDGVPATRYWVPALTTIETDAFDLGHQAAQSLLDAFATGDPVASFTQEPQLIIRDSCGSHGGA